MSKIRIIPIVGLAVLSLGLVQCGGSPAIPMSFPPNTVQIINSAFSPSSMTVPVNTAVHWVNLDSVNHDATSNPSGPLNSGPLAPGMSYDFTFMTTGTYPYYCTIHGLQMSAGIVVN